MCHFISAIMTKDNIYADPSDSHHVIAQVHKLVVERGDPGKPRLFFPVLLAVGVQIEPPGGDISAPVEEWHFGVGPDGDSVFPRWWKPAKAEARMRAALPGILKARRRRYRDDLPQGHWIVGKHLVRVSLYDESRMIQWTRFGRRDRVGGAAFIVEGADGRWSESWMRNGEFHRLDGPAYVNVEADGSWSESWYRNGQLHRQRGPAVTRVKANGSWAAEWYRDGEYIRCEVVA